MRVLSVLSVHQMDRDGFDATVNKRIEALLDERDALGG
jgi:hypothetical protein